MTIYEAPHEVRDDAKITSMICAIEDGRKLPPIIVQGHTAFCGTHRIAAWCATDTVPEVVEISDEEYCAAMEYLGLDAVYDNPPSDLDDFCAALVATGAELGDAQP